MPIDIDVLVVAASQSELRDAAEQIRSAEGRLRFHGWKEFADGSLGGHTAAMYEPFADKPDTRGMTRLNVAHAIEMGQASLDLGGVVAIHAIGDRANDTVVGVHSRLIDAGADPGRLRIEHASVLKEMTIERMGQLGIVASVQPAFLASEEDWLEKRLGADRMKDAYPFRSLSEAGVQMLGGSDSPVELPDPEVGIKAAIDRHGINVDQSLDHNDAVSLFTHLRAESLSQVFILREPVVTMCRDAEYLGRPPRPVHHESLETGVYEAHPSAAKGLRPAQDRRRREAPSTPWNQPCPHGH